MAEDGRERTEQPTQRKRQDARRKGTVAKSIDLSGSLSLLAVALLMPWMASSLGRGWTEAFYNQVSQVPNEVSTGTMLAYVGALAWPAVSSVGPVLVMVLVVVLTVNFAQVGFVVSAEAMNPKFEKIDPFKGVKRVLSARALMEGFKATVKFGLFGWIAYATVKADWDRIVGLSWMSVPDSIVATGQTLHTVLLRVSLAWLALAALDYFFQRQQTEKQLMMTRDELKREMKEQEGSPEIKAAQYRKRRQMAKGGMATRLQEADVVLTNPTHYSVALRYKRDEDRAPVVVAKGADYLALRIREMAEDLGVPVMPNPPLARALYKQCEVGDHVPRDLFGPVAEVLAFVYRNLKRAQKRRRPA